MSTSAIPYDDPQPHDFKPDRIRRAALKWIAENPAKVHLARDLALERAAKFKRFGMKHVVEDARWETPPMPKVKGEPYKFTNTYTAILARYLAWKHPEIRGRIRLKLRSDELKHGRIVLVTDADLPVTRE